MPKAKAQEKPEPQAKKLQETFTHPLEQVETRENAQSDEDEREQLPKNNNNNNNSTSQAPRINHRASVAKMEGLAAYMDSSIMSSSTEVDGDY